MSINRAGCRADVCRVENILSEPAARPITAEADEPFTEITPEHIDRMGKVTSILQEIVWETYKGTHGPATLLKEVSHEIMCCPDCEVPGRYDHNGEITCENDCGRILSEGPMMIPEDSYNGRVDGVPSGSEPKPALRDAVDTDGPAEMR